MKKEIALITDSVANLPDSYIIENNIYLISLYVVIDDQFYKDGIDITSEDLFLKNEQSAKFMAKSSAPSPDDFSQIYEKIRDDGFDKAIYVGMASSLSSSISNAQLAEKHGLDLRVIDSGGVSIVEGMLAMYAKDLIDEGLSIDDIEEKLNKNVGNAIAYGWTDSLKYLKAGGRLSKAAQQVSTILNLKPLVTLDSKGNIDLIKLKTSKEKSYKLVNEKIRENLSADDKYYIAYVCGKDMTMLDQAQELMSDLTENAIESMIDHFTSVVAVHAGPKAYAVGYLIVAD